MKRLLPLLLCLTLLLTAHAPLQTQRAAAEAAYARDYTGFGFTRWRR